MEEKNKGILKKIIGVLSIIESLSKSEKDLRSLVRLTGWEFDDLTGFNLSDISDTLGPLSDDLQTLLTYIDEPPDSFGKLGEAFDKAEDAFGRLARLKEVLQNADLDGPDKDKLLAFSKDLLNILAAVYVRTKFPLAFYFLYLLTLVDFDDADLEPVTRSDGKIVRHACLLPKFRPGRLSDILTKPKEYYGAYYFPDGLKTDQDALLAAHKLFPRVANILNDIGINTQMGFSTENGLDLGPENNQLAKGMLTAYFEPNFENINFGVSLALSPASRANLGLVVIPFGSLNFTKTFGSWQFELNLAAGIEGFALGSEGATLLAGIDTSEVKLMFKISKLPGEEGEAAIYIGGRTGSRLEIGELSFSTATIINEGNFDLDLLVEASKGKFVLKPGDGDSFLAKVLPKDGFELNFDLGLGWSKRSGLYFKGNAGLEVEYNIHESILGVVEVQTIGLGLNISESAFNFNANTSLKIKIGPVTAVINKIGVKIETSFVEEGGNAGIANNKISFKTPTGIGLSVDAGGIKGGGILDFNPEKKEYFGALELDFQDKFSLKAFGILNTRMPDGSNGFSLLIIITAEFTPIQLGYGFTLNGVGGLLGVNRTTKVDVLKEGLKTNTLKSILFPEDIVANINRIVSDIKQVFPPHNGRFLICPMGKIGWGASIITLELGILIEIPVTDIKILGVLKVVLPNDKDPLLKLQVNFLGIIDFENKLISFDAFHYDSRILTFTITGQMALRIDFRNDVFIISSGGFHPAFKEIPDDLTNMERITISLYDGENARIISQNYFAITSNTIQYGLKAELFAGSSSGFNIYGHISFDIIFKDIDEFIADFGAGVALRRGTSVIMGINVSGRFTGLSPLDIRGEASVSFFFFSVSVPFHVQIGNPIVELAKELAHLIEILTEQINDDRNWIAKLPPNNKLHVTTRTITIPDSIAVHPFGILCFSERIVPLEIEIKKFGYQLPKDANKFQVKINDPDLQTEDEKEQFAPANFFEMTDEEKLSRPSFEQMKSGFKITGSAQLKAAPHVVKKPVDYEFSYLGKKKKTKPDHYIYPGNFFKANTKSAASSQSSLSHQNNRVSMNAPELVEVTRDRYVIANTSDMKLHNDKSVADSYTEALQQYNDLIQKKPELKGQIQVLAEYELN